MINKIVEELINASSPNGKFDDDIFIKEQSKLHFDIRREIRFSEKIARIVFNVNKVNELESKYYFWDNTTLCMKVPLLKLVPNSANVLEIGCGPSATLSIFLSKSGKNLTINCAELNPEFLKTAIQCVHKNYSNITIKESDMTSGYEGTLFDVIFMNPPYVKSATLNQFHIKPETGEGYAGDGGSGGGNVVELFLNETPKSLSPNGMSILGVNTLHLEDEHVVKMIEQSEYKLKAKYYKTEITQPNGPYSQLYILQLR